MSAVASPGKFSPAMLPIPGGEFLMGGPPNEPGHKPDEAPQHKVKISPFWMQQCEVTWNEYELFMYPDEEKRTRASMASVSWSSVVDPELCTMRLLSKCPS